MDNNNPDLDDLEDEISILAKGVVNNDVDNEDIYDSDNDDDNNNDNNNDNNMFSKIEENVVDQIFGPSVNTLWSKKTRIRSGKTAGKRLPPEIYNTLADAQNFFISRRYDEAIQLLSEVTRLAPKFPDPYHTMGMIYVESGDILRGIQFYAIAATYTPNCYELWRKIASLAYDIGEYHQAIQALNTAIKMNSTDPNLYRFRILIAIKHNKNHHAKELIKTFLLKFPTQIDIHLECADLFISYGFKKRALQSLLRYILQIIGTSDISNLNSIMTLYKLSLFPEFLKPIQIIYLDSNKDLDMLMFSVRKLCDVMMEEFDYYISNDDDMQESRNIILSITKAIIIYIEKLQNEYNKMSKITDKFINFENLKISMDVGLIYGNCLLQSKNDSNINKGVLVIRPLLEIINKLDDEYTTKLNEISSNSIDHTIPASVFDNETDFFLTRQMFRIATSFAQTGKKTRAEKILSSAIVRFNRMTGNESNSPTNTLSREEQAKCWRQIGNVYEVLGNNNKAMFSYTQGIEHDMSDPICLIRFCYLTRKFASNLCKHAIDFVGTHMSYIFSSFIKTTTDTFDDIPNNDNDDDVINDDAELSFQSTSISIHKTDQTCSDQYEKFTQITLENELKALVEWAFILYDSKDMKSFCAVALPILESWISSFIKTGKVANRDRTQATNTDVSEIYVEMKQLRACSNINFKNREWLDNTQNICFRFVSAICEFVNIELVFGSEILIELAKITEASMKHLNKHQEVEAIMTACSIFFPSEGSRRNSNDLISNKIIHKTTKRVKTSVSKSTKSLSTEDNNNDADYIDDSDSENSYSDYSDSDEEVRNKIIKQNSNIRRELNKKNNNIKISNKSESEKVYNNNENVVEEEEEYMDYGMILDKVYKVGQIKLIYTPNDMVNANSFARSILFDSSKNNSQLNRFNTIEGKVPIQRVYSSHPNCLVAHLLSAHDFASKRKYSETLERYLDSFCLDTDQPLTSLCLASFLVYFCQHNLVLKRNEILLKAFSFLGHYKSVRIKSFRPYKHVNTEMDTLVNEEKIFLNEHSLEQEFYYNFGRFYHDLRLYHLAVHFYKKSLELADRHPLILQNNGLDVTQESAHNYVLILKESESFDLALEIMKKYLVV